MAIPPEEAVSSRRKVSAFMLNLIRRNRSQPLASQRTAAFLCLCIAGSGTAQELVPRAYWPTPVGTNVLIVGYQHSRGDIVVDQSLPVSGVDSRNDFLQVSYQRSIDSLGRSASIQISQSVADGTTTGTVEGSTVTRRTVGALDTIGRFAINLLGAPAMDAEGMMELRAAPRPIVGTSLTVSVPTGQYDEERVINLGTNRVSLKPEIGAIVPLGNTLLLEVDAGVWFFQDNDEFVGRTREQEPVWNVQLHLVQQFKPGFWAALDANFYGGGRTTVDGNRNRDLQRNSRLGATVVYPFARGQALRFALSTGTVTETGGDFELFSISWLRAF